MMVLKCYTVLQHATNFACSQPEPWSDTASALSWSFSRGIKGFTGLICFKYGHAQTERAIHTAAEDRHLADCLGAGLVEQPQDRGQKLPLPSLATGSQ